MRQVIARVDDDLHERLRAKAAAEGRSMNALIVEALDNAAPHLDARGRLRARLEAAAMLHEPPRTDAPAPDETLATEAGAGAGSAVSEALLAERAAR